MNEPRSVPRVSCRLDSYSVVNSVYSSPSVSDSEGWRAVDVLKDGKRTGINFGMGQSSRATLVSGSLVFLFQFRRSHSKLSDLDSLQTSRNLALDHLSGVLDHLSEVPDHLSEVLE
jgi:hypothetical protein